MIQEQILSKYPLFTHKMQYVNARAKQSCKHEKCLDQSYYTIGSELTFVIFFVLGYPLQRKVVCVNACVCLCSVEEEILGISLALMDFTGLCLRIHVFLHICVHLYIGANDRGLQF